MADLRQRVPGSDFPNCSVKNLLERAKGNTVSSQNTVPIIQARDRWALEKENLSWHQHYGLQGNSKQRISNLYELSQLHYHYNLQSTDEKVLHVGIFI